MGTCIVSSRSRPEVFRLKAAYVVGYGDYVEEEEAAWLRDPVDYCTRFARDPNPQGQTITVTSLAIAKPRRPLRAVRRRARSVPELRATPTGRPGDGSGGGVRPAVEIQAGHGRHARVPQSGPHGVRKSLASRSGDDDGVATSDSRRQLGHFVDQRPRRVLASASEADEREVSAGARLGEDEANPLVLHRHRERDGLRAPRHGP